MKFTMSLLIFTLSLGASMGTAANRIPASLPCQNGSSVDLNGESTVPARPPQEASSTPTKTPRTYQKPKGATQ